jgi:hypothetical protein
MVYSYKTGNNEWGLLEVLACVKQEAGVKVQVEMT